ncbi:MAG: DEAD/DEAH box helicase family protein [Verrucomicrobiales bacterium]
MIALKDYQARCLESLGDYLRLVARTSDPASAFGEITQRQFQEPLQYLPVSVAGLPSKMPYVCLRVPTGGGKTLLACHACGLAETEFLEADRSVVLWLVPSTTILDQTADALRDPRHPYRRALETVCGDVEVLRITEALSLSRAVADGKTVVIVSTIQAFRADDPTGRKVHSQAGALSEHFLNLPEGAADDLIPGADGKPIPSLVNALRLRRPVVIVDEAHNARTDLSFAALADVRPSCIVEFTATPAKKKHPSNVLHQVSAAELASEDMVKLPLRVVRRDKGQKDQLLLEAVSLRKDLEKLAEAERQSTGEYIRPILLIQAERVDECEPLRERLVEDFGVERDRIVISVGTKDELKEISEIESPKCPVRVIITVQKLSEGWDCPFAYVLCSLKESRSATAIEQIVGRILRLPKVKKKTHPDLNCGYVLSVSPSLEDVLSELVDALESNGYTRTEAHRIVIPGGTGTLPLGVQPQTAAIGAENIDEEAATAKATALEGKVRIEPKEGTITVVTPLSDDEIESLEECVKTPEARKQVREVAEMVREVEKAMGGDGKPRPPTPYERQLDFLVPLLSIREEDEYFEFEKTFLLEHPWKLSAKDANLPDAYDPTQRKAGSAGLIFLGDKGKIEGGKVGEDEETDFVAQLHQQVMAFARNTDWTVEQLVAWLDRKIRHQDIPVSESTEYLRKSVRGLMASKGIEDVSLLVLDRYRLRDIVRDRIEAHREAERKEAHQALLLSDSALTVTEEVSVNFQETLYEPSWLYDGSFPFKKHYYGPRPGELHEKTPSSGKLGEEFKCAKYLDQMPEVEFWVRNLSQRETSFRLLTSRQFFYPDFVCKLVDGRILAVEYKGGHLYDSPDSEEKRAIGAVWEARSEGKCLFVMPTAGDFDKIAAKIG